MKFNIGETYKAKINNGTYKIHIVGVVDGNMVVYKFYGKHKQRWHYDVIAGAYLDLIIVKEDAIASGDSK